MENKDLYLKTMKCPVCEHIFKSTKVKSKSIRISHRDSDFCAYFLGENPYFYEVSVCPECGFAATDTEYDKIKSFQREIILEKISPNWAKRDVNGVRTIEDAINSYKLALYEARFMEKEHQYIGMLSLKLSWLYRYEKKYALENRFLGIALGEFKEAYKKESFNTDFSVGQCCYLVGEIYKKFDDTSNAIKWYEVALKYCKFNEIKLQKLIKEQWQNISKERRSVKEAVN